jgi:hypothetical protein
MVRENCGSNRLGHWLRQLGHHLSTQWQSDAEHRAAAQPFAGGRNGALVFFNKPPGKCQSQPQAAPAAHLARLRLTAAELLRKSQAGSEYSRKWLI